MRYLLPATLIYFVPLFCDQSSLQTPPLLETKGSYFFFASDTIRDVYSSGGFEIQVSGSYPIWKCVHIYGSLGFLEAWGDSTHFNQSTSIWEIPVDLGLKSLFNLTSFVQYYIALGPRYFYVHQHNHSAYVNKNMSQNGVGLFTNTGFNFILKKHFLIDIFGEYSYEPTSFSSSMTHVYTSDIQLSKFAFGAGLGYAF
jgi:hypothetical protein